MPLSNQKLCYIRILYEPLKKEICFLIFCKNLDFDTHCANGNSLLPGIFYAFFKFNFLKKFFQGISVLIWIRMYSFSGGSRVGSGGFA